MHVLQGCQGQTVTVTLPSAEAAGRFCFLVGSAARSKQLMDDIAGSVCFNRRRRFLVCVCLNTVRTGTKTRDYCVSLDVDVDVNRRNGIAGAGLSLYSRLISHFNITNVVI